MDQLPTAAKLLAMAAWFVSFLFVLRLLKSMHRLLFSNKKYPPVAGTIFHHLLNLHRLHDLQTELSRRYKTFRILTPFCNYIFISDPANVEYILKTNFANFGKGNMTHEILKDFLGDGIFSVDGDKWRHQRKLASFEFSTKVLGDYSRLVFRRNAAKLFGLISESAHSKEIIDIQDLLMKSTMDAIFKVGFGLELDTLGGSNKKGRIFAKAFDDINSQIHRRFFDVFWKIKKLLSFGLEAKLKEDIKLIDDFVYSLIDEKVEQLSQKKDDSIMKEDVLSKLLKERKSDPDTITYQYLRDIVLNILIAGRDTTAGTLSWFFYMLCKHPDVQEKVAQEIREAIMERENLSIKEFIEFLNEGTLSGMNYLHAALTETMRLYPAVPLDPKYCFSDDKLPDGFNLNKGDIVFYQPYAMGRMEFLWGADAEVFRPDRWLNADGQFEPESPFKFTAFQAGPRICLGKDFAYRQMKIFAATLLYYFKFELSGDKTVNYRPMMTLQIDGGLHLRALCSSILLLAMEKSWMSKPKYNPEYICGIDSFIEFASHNLDIRCMMLCPCRACSNKLFQTPKEIWNHLFAKGMYSGYVVWNRHGEQRQPVLVSVNINQDKVTEPVHGTFVGVDNMKDLFRDTIGPSNVQPDVEAHDAELDEVPVDEQHNAESSSNNTGVFATLLQQANQELYPGCNKYSKLSFTLHLYQLKCINS